MTVKEPITVVISQKGWIRALRGHVTDTAGLTFKDDDRLKFFFPSETTSKILVFATNGRFYTIDGAKLPGGRGHGEPIRLYAEMEQETDIVTALNYAGGRKFLVASATGRGFIVKEDDCLATTRKGKQVLNVKMPDEARAMAQIDKAIGGFDRREPEDGAVPARSIAGDGARRRRPAAALQGRRAVRREDLRARRGAHRRRLRRAQFQFPGEGAARLARQ
jgi:DNA gyrase/topoisomerase IV subunit A